MNKEQTIKAIKAGKRVTIPIMTNKQPQSLEQVLRDLVNAVTSEGKIKRLGHNNFTVYSVSAQSTLIANALESIKQLPENDPRNNEEYPNW